MNLLTLAGHLGADPEVRFISSGKKVTTLRIAARARRSGKDETIWWRVSLWGEEFDPMISYFKKGSAVMVVGEMNKPEIFIDRDGKSQVSMSMTGSQLMFSPFGTGNARPENANQNMAPNLAGHQDSSPASPYAQEGAFATSNYGTSPAQGATYGTAYGQSSSPMGSSYVDSTNLSEDEIPF